MGLPLGKNNSIEYRNDGYHQVKQVNWFLPPKGHQSPLVANTSSLNMGNDVCSITCGVIMAEEIFSQILKIQCEHSVSHWLSIAMNTNDQSSPVTILCSRGFHDTITSHLSSYVSGPFCWILQGLLKDSILLPPSLWQAPFTEYLLCVWHDAMFKISILQNLFI